VRRNDDQVARGDGHLQADWEEAVGREEMQRKAAHDHVIGRPRIDNGVVGN
jgi:hypothetical protein